MMSMDEEQSPPISITADDIRAFNFEEILSRAGSPELPELKDRTYFNYEKAFVEEAKIAQEAGAKSRYEICVLFATLCSFHPSLDTKEYFTPKWHLTSGLHGALPSDISPALQELLLETVRNIEDPELRARVADVLWVLKKGRPEVGIVAIEAYIASANKLHDPEHWPHSADRIERALQLAAGLGKEGESYKRVIAHIEELVQRLNGEDPLWFSHRLMSLLLRRNAGDPEKYIPLADQLALNAEEQHEWRLAREHWQILAKWQVRMNDETAASVTRKRAAETYVRQAEQLLNQPTPEYRAASRELSQAITALKNANACREKIQETHKLLLECQERDQDFGEVAASISLNAVIESAQKTVTGKALRDAILALADNIRPVSADALEQQVQEHMKNNPLYFLISAQMLSADGKVRAQRPSALAGSEDAEQEVKSAHMHFLASIHQEIMAQGFIIPAVDQINNEHNVRLEDLAELVQNNPFVPPSHELIFARGLYYGLIGDFMLASHLLIPQFENLIRYVLNQRGVITSTHDSNGIQEEFNLGRILKDVPETTQLFGKDLVMDLQGLLVSRFGSNLRNHIAHGMAGSNEVQSLRAVYAWGIMLSLCCYPILIAASRPQNDDAEQSES